MNKIDLARNTQALDRFRDQINREVAELGDCYRGVFFVSAENPRIGDWVQMMDTITSCATRSS